MSAGGANTRFTYIRVHHGIEGKGWMGKKGLRPWAARVRALTMAGKDVYFYFNNDLGDTLWKTRCSSSRCSGADLLEEREVLPVTFGLELVHRNEPHRRRVHAVAEARRLWSVVEDVTEM